MNEIWILKKNLYLPRTTLCKKTLPLVLKYSFVSILAMRSVNEIKSRELKSNKYYGYDWGMIIRKTK